MNIWRTLALCLLLPPISYAATSWQPIQTGLAITTMKKSLFDLEPRIIAYRIDPKRYQLQLAFAKPTALIKQFASTTTALLAINGGYFSTDAKPLGLRISHFKKFSTKKPISWWGVFYLADEKPYIVSSNDYIDNPSTQFAIQAGPRLLINGQLATLKGGNAQRSAICITNNQQVVIAVTHNTPLTLTKWAETLRNIGCRDALNLDGGTSSQLYSNLPTKSYNVSNYKPITDAIIVSS